MLAVKILTDKLTQAGIPIAGVSGNEPPFLVEFAAGATQQQRDAAAAIVAAFDPAVEVAAEEAKEAAIADAPITARAWFVANPNAKLIWSMTVAEVVAEVAALIDVSFPGATAGTRTKWKLLITAMVLVVRIRVKGDRLD